MHSSLGSATGLQTVSAAPRPMFLPKAVAPSAAPQKATAGATIDTSAFNNLPKDDLVEQAYELGQKTLGHNDVPLPPWLDLSQRRVATSVDLSKDGGSTRTVTLMDSEKSQMLVHSTLMATNPNPFPIGVTVGVMDPQRGKLQPVGRLDATHVDLSRGGRQSQFHAIIPPGAQSLQLKNAVKLGDSDVGVLAYNFLGVAPGELGGRVAVMPNERQCIVPTNHPAREVYLANMHQNQWPAEQPAPIDNYVVMASEPVAQCIAALNSKISELSPCISKGRALGVQLTPLGKGTPTGDVYLELDARFGTRPQEE